MMIERDAYTIIEFCHRHGLTRGSYYTLLKAGQGPRTIRFGTTVKISKEAAEDWRREMEAKAGAHRVADPVA